MCAHPSLLGDPRNRLRSVNGEQRACDLGSIDFEDKGVAAKVQIKALERLIREQARTNAPLEQLLNANNVPDPEARGARG